MVNTTPRGLNISLDRSGYTIFVLGFWSVGKMVFERMARPKFFAWGNCFASKIYLL